MEARQELLNEKFYASVKKTCEKKYLNPPIKVMGKAMEQYDAKRKELHDSVIGRFAPK